MSEHVKKELNLPVGLTIAEVEDLKKQWTETLDEASDLAINAEAVQHADCAGLQLLLAVVRGIRAKEGLVTWSGAAGPVSNVATTLGMADQLGIKQ